MPKLKTPCIVELLDGSEIEIENKYLHHSEDFLHYVCRYVGVAERDYLGLRYTNLKDNKMSWLDLNEPLIRQLRKAAGNRFKLAIQFFPDTIDMLQDEVTRYQFVLQTRENLLTGKWSCSIPTQALLASYIVQAEFHNYDITKHGEDYLVGLQFAYGQTADFLNKVALFHKNHKDLTASDAEWLYMKTARKMVMYGMDVYDVVDGDGNVLTLGIDVYGVHILFLNTVLHTFVWVVISKICCHGKEVVFSIKVSSDDHHSEHITVGFLLTTERDAKRVSKACNQNKDFFNLAAIRKVVRKTGKNIPCTHISTRALPKDFKRVDSFEYCKRFEKAAIEERIANGEACEDAAEASNRKQSMDEASSKDTATSNPELNHIEQVSDDELNHSSSNIESEVPANIHLLTAEGDGCQDKHSMINSVFMHDDDDLVTAEVMNDIIKNVEDNDMTTKEIVDMATKEIVDMGSNEIVDMTTKETVDMTTNEIVDMTTKETVDMTTKEIVNSISSSNVSVETMNDIDRKSSFIECVLDGDIEVDFDLLIIEDGDIENLLSTSQTKSISATTTTGGNYYNNTYEEYDVIENSYELMAK